MAQDAARDFSNRHQFRSRPSEVVREEAPPALRTFVLRHLAEESSYRIHETRQMVSRAIGYVASPAKSSVDEIWKEIEHHVRTCPWYLIYDLIEELYRLRSFKSNFMLTSSEGPAFQKEVNEFFEQENIGWQLTVDQIENGFFGTPSIVARGSEAFEAVLKEAPSALAEAGMSTAAHEIHQAIADLSRRPTADLTGAVQHGMAALECASRFICEMTGRQTLNDAVKARPDLFRPPLNEAILKLWGFASNRGRHVVESGEPTRPEAELVVGIAATVATYISRLSLEHDTTFHSCK